MSRKLGFFAVVVLAALVAAPSVCAQIEFGVHARPRITQSVDEMHRVALEGNTRPEAKAENDRGTVAAAFTMEHMLLQLKRSPEQELALQQFIDELHTKGSPNFHHWLTAMEFGERFGLSQQDLDAITAWLESYGFKINVVYPNVMHQMRKPHTEFTITGIYGNATYAVVPADLAKIYNLNALFSAGTSGQG